MNTSFALQLGNEQHLLDRRVEFPYDLAGNSVRTPSGRAKATFSSELAEPRHSSCDSGVVRWIKLMAYIAGAIQLDCTCILLPRFCMGFAKATRVTSLCSYHNGGIPRISPRTSSSLPLSAWTLHRPSRGQRWQRSVAMIGGSSTLSARGNVRTAARPTSPVVSPLCY